MKTSEICSNKCFGIDNYDGSCCSIEDRDFIIGPHNDCDDFINKLTKKFNRKIDKNSVFIYYEEGKQLFPNKINWQNINNYPAFRIDINSSKKNCIFYNTHIKSCSIYDIRPSTCKNYKCNYLIEALKK